VILNDCKAAAHHPRIALDRHRSQIVWIGMGDIDSEGDITWIGQE